MDSYLIVSGTITIFALLVPFANYIFLSLSSSVVAQSKIERKIPPWLPYLIPVLGHSITFLSAPLKLATMMRKPIRLRFPGINPYIISGTDNIRAFFRINVPTNAAREQHTARVVRRVFGMPKETADAFIRDNSGFGRVPLPDTNVDPRNRVGYVNHQFIASLFRGPELNVLVAHFQKMLVQEVNSLPIDDQWMEMPDLFSFLTSLMTPVIIEVFFGPSLTQVIDPHFVQKLWDFDTYVATLAKGAPSWLFPRGSELRDSMRESLKRWRLWMMQGPQQDRVYKVPRAMVEKLKLMDADGFDLSGICAGDLAFIWASNTQPTLAAFWMNHAVLRSPWLISRIRAEVEASTVTTAGNFTSPDAVSDQSSSIDLQLLLKKPYLEACFAETLRQRTHIFLPRSPGLVDAMINEWQIPAKSLMMVLSTVPHTDDTLWDTGLNASHPLTSFWPGRFLRYPVDGKVDGTTTGTRSKQHTPGSTTGANGDASLEDSERAPEAENPPQFVKRGLEGVWIPFGGGSRMCPGHRFAKAAMILVTALLVSQFDIELCDPMEEVKVSWWSFGTGVIKPASKPAFRIRRRAPVQR